MSLSPDTHTLERAGTSGQWEGLCVQLRVRRVVPAPLPVLAQRVVTELQPAK